MRDKLQMGDRLRVQRFRSEMRDGFPQPPEEVWLPARFVRFDGDCPVIKWPDGKWEVLQNLVGVRYPTPMEDD